MGFIKRAAGVITGSAAAGGTISGTIAANKANEAASTFSKASDAASQGLRIPAHQLMDLGQKAHDALSQIPGAIEQGTAAGAIAATLAVTAARLHHVNSKRQFLKQTDED